MLGGCKRYLVRDVAVPGQSHREFLLMEVMDRAHSQCYYQQIGHCDPVTPICSSNTEPDFI